MKFIVIVSLFTTFLFSEVYYSKVEPVEVRDISSDVSGLVLKANENLLGKKLSTKPYIIIDSELDIKELNFLKKKISYLNNTVFTNENILKNLQESLKRKRDNYEKIKSLKIKSSIEKDREFYELINSENLFLNTKKEILSLKVQITDLSLRYSQLQRTIKDKNLIADGFVLYTLLVKAGKVVSKSTPLAQIADISKAKLTIYLDKEDIYNAENKTVFIDAKKTDYKITRVVRIADSKNISKYKAEIIIDSPKVFSNLVKIELK
ncbi:MAG: HlyD family efflux transporter periplasmic adaptor subunit [Campylobacterota bacterium]|nr:HlyD family efflux transporter periplasmic adaptor subunit [Campylobacterota bacterium]